MLTPFTENNEIDIQALQELVDWYISHQVSGLFTVCQSSEMFFLSLEERLILAEHVVRLSGGRVPVIASAIETASMDKHIEEIKRLAAAGIDACVLISNQYAKPDVGDDAFRRTIEHILEEVPGLPFGIYECPYPYKRLVSPELLRWFADTGRFMFLKDTCCNLEQIEQKLLAVAGTPLKIYNANSATLLESLRLGAAGFSGVMANFHPDLYVWLIKHWQDEPELAEELQRFLGIASLIELQHYPINAKYSLRQEGLSIHTLCRTKEHDLLGSADRLVARQLQAFTQSMRNKIIKA